MKHPKSLTTEQEINFIKMITLDCNTRKQAIKAQRNKLICILMLDAGLRVGEVRRLRIADLMFMRNPVMELQIVNGIAEKGCDRTIPTTLLLRSQIQNCENIIWSEYGLSDVDFATSVQPASPPLTVRQIQRIVAKIAIKTFGYSINPHMLRHTYATKLMRVTNIRVVQQLLGHKNIDSTAIYTHPSNFDRQKAVEQLNNRSERSENEYSNGQ